jgi:hypothetical protein
MGDNEIRKLRAALAERESGRGKRYTSSLKDRIAGAATQLRQQGRSWQRIGSFLGVSHETARRFSGASRSPAFVPVEVLEVPSRGGLVLVSPDGYRVEGLGVDEAAAILRRLR